MENDELESPCSPDNAIRCEPELKAATRTLYDLRNKQKLQNFIIAELTPKNYFKYHVENLPMDGEGCPGKWLFETAWQHFAIIGTAIDGIRAEWSFGDNLDAVNRLTSNKSITIEEAAEQTWSYSRAEDKGFTTILLLDSIGTAGKYLSVDLLFLP